MGLSDFLDNMSNLFDDLKENVENVKENLGLPDLKEKLDDFLDDEKPGSFSILKEKISPLPPAVRLAQKAGKHILFGKSSEAVYPEEGSIVVCKILGNNFEHSGVYVGGGNIVELNGNGEIRKVSWKQFLGSSLFRSGTRIYTACDKEYGDVISSYDVADRALSMVGEKRNYNIVFDNCHQFTAGCITGNFENSVNFFWILEDTIKKEMNLGDPIKWKVCNFD